MRSVINTRVYGFIRDIVTMIFRPRILKAVLNSSAHLLRIQKNVRADERTPVCARQRKQSTTCCWKRLYRAFNRESFA